MCVAPCLNGAELRCRLQSLTPCADVYMSTPQATHDTTVVLRSNHQQARADGFSLCVCVCVIQLLDRCFHANKQKNIFSFLLIEDNEVIVKCYIRKLKIYIYITLNYSQSVLVVRGSNPVVSHLIDLIGSSPHHHHHHHHHHLGMNPCHLCLPLCGSLLTSLSWLY